MTYMYAGLRDWPISYRLVFSYGYQLVRMAVQVRRNLLRNIDIIGCTTTGAAKLATLLKGLSPRVLLVEEAGQVLEAHVLGSLVPSIEHLIMIGDPLQLRPTLNNFWTS